MITKTEIKQSIVDLYGSPIRTNDPRIQFSGYNTFHKKNINHPLINGAIAGGYERTFYDRIGFFLKRNLILTKSTFFFRKTLPKETFSNDTDWRSHSLFLTPKYKMYQYGVKIN